VPIHTRKHMLDYAHLEHYKADMDKVRLLVDVAQLVDPATQQTMDPRVVTLLDQQVWTDIPSTLDGLLQCYQRGCSFFMVTQIISCVQDHLPDVEVDVQSMLEHILHHAISHASWTAFFDDMERYKMVERDWHAWVRQTCEQALLAELQIIQEVSVFLNVYTFYEQVCCDLVS
jgi:hypothetical protein